MSFSLDADTKERVRAATDIVDLVSGYNLDLRRQGRGYVALCPWHQDRRPSLQVNPERQIWKCWVCDIGGDVFNFVMKQEGIGFSEAIKLLAERAAITLPSSGPAKKDGSRTTAEDKAILYRVMAWASRLYHQYLLKNPEAAVARGYLAERGFTAESIERFEIGMVPDSWSYLIDQVPESGYNLRHLEATGLIKRGERGHSYDLFRNRVMFPIRDTQKRVIAFGGRVLPGGGDAAKYINSPESQIFTKHQHLYGLDMARDTIRERRQAIVMEGYTDVIIAHQCGLSGAVAVLGTALGSNHLKLLRHLCDQVILVLDGDAAGQRRSDEVLELFLSAQMDVRVLTLPDGLDPADYLLRENAEAILTLASTAPDALEFKMRRVCEGFDPLEETHRSTTAMEQMLTLLSKVPRSSLITDDAFLLRRNQVLARLAKRFMVSEDELRNRLRGMMGRGARGSQIRGGDSRGASQYSHRQSTGSQRASQRSTGLDTHRAKGELGEKAAIEEKAADAGAAESLRLVRPGDLTPVERELLELVISAPNIAPMVLERVVPDWITSEAARRMLEAYHELELDGQSLEFDSVLVALEDPSLKSLLVTLYEQAQVKQQFVKDTPEQRLRVITQRMGKQQEELHRRHQLSILANGGLDDQAELDLLSDFIRQARQSHGLDDVAETEEEPEISQE